jgi:hypothetical protein
VRLEKESCLISDLTGFIKKKTLHSLFTLRTTFSMARISVFLVCLIMGGLLFGGVSLGQTVGAEITISTNPEYPQSVDKGQVTAPCLAYDPTHDRFLAVWRDKREADIYLYGRFVGADGVPQEKAFPICDTRKV